MKTGDSRSPADILFSLYIRIRDGFTCQKCFAIFNSHVGLDCSHYHRRGKRSVRFDPENAMAACRKCHDFLGDNPRAHTQFFMVRLGIDRFDALERRANQPQRIYEDEVMEKLKHELNRMGYDTKGKPLSRSQAVKFVCNELNSKGDPQ